MSHQWNVRLGGPILPQGRQKQTLMPSATLSTCFVFSLEAQNLHICPACLSKQNSFLHNRQPRPFTPFPSQLGMQTRGRTCPAHYITPHDPPPRVGCGVGSELVPVLTESGASSEQQGTPAAHGRGLRIPGPALAFPEATCKDTRQRAAGRAGPLDHTHIQGPPAGEFRRG